MAAVRVLLLVTCAWAVSAGPIGPACSPAQTGILFGPPIPVQTTLQPGIRDWKVNIPDLPQCRFGPLGAFATVCDSDVAPTVNFLSRKVIQIHRNGNLQSYGTVDVQIFCGLLQQQQNQPLIQHNHQHLSNNQHGQQQLYVQPTVSTGQKPNNLWNLDHNSQAALKVIPLHPGHLSLPSLGHQLPLLDQRSQSQYLSLEQSSLPSLTVSALDHSHNPLLRVTHQSILGQSSLPSLSVSPVSQKRSSLPSLEVSSASHGHSSLQSLSVSPLSAGRISGPSLTVSPVSHGQSSMASYSSPVTSGHSPLSSLRVTPSEPLSLQDQTYNPWVRQSPQQLLHLGQSSLPLLQLREVPQLLSSKPPPYVGQWPLLSGQTSYNL